MGQATLAAVLCAAALTFRAAPVSAQNAPQTLASVTVNLAWNRDGVSLKDGRLSLTNDLGYRIVLEQAYIVNLSVELIPCHEWSGKLNGGIGTWIQALLFGRSAHAGHSLFGSPSKLQNSVAESLLGSAPMTLGKIDAPDVEYCSLHYLIGRAWAVTKALPSMPDLLNLSLFLSGQFSPPGKGEAQAFLIKSSEASGRILTMVQGDGQGGDRNLPKPAKIVVTRRISGLFDGIDFSNPVSAETARAVLQNLVTGSTVTAGTR
ncbi:MAG: hypothetical protein O3A84_11625 [Proteobacteria bacterium]|nr:hypothetical protein [Pseudomonadota bacterium]